MIPRKLSEIFFSQLWLLLIPIAVTPLLVAAALRDEPTFESRAAVWVGSTSIGSSVFGEGSPYNSRAQNQAQVVNDLLATDSFRSKVATSAGLVDATEDDRTRTRVGRDMTVWAGTVGLNVVTITARSSSADDAAAIVQATVDQYLDRATEEAQRRADVAEEYYSQQLGIAEAELFARDQALQTYLAEHPDAQDPTSPAALDLDHRVLRDRVESQRIIVEELRAALQSTARELASAPQSQEAAFAIQDAPIVPDAPLPVSISSRIGLPAAGLILGIIASLTYFLVRYRTDHSIRSEEDLQGLAVPLLGAVTEVHPPGLLWRLSPAAVFRRRYWLTFAQRSAASIPMREEALT
jgi:capsular polysaccharide biosynthesis protein